MGNRLGSPRKRKQAAAAATKSDVAVVPPAGGGGEGDPSTTTGDGASRRPTAPPAQSSELTLEQTTPTTGDDRIQSQSQLAPWQIAASAVHSVDAFAQPVRDQHERQRQRRERLALVADDPDLFFSLHSKSPESESESATTEALQEHAGVRYTQALLLKARGETAAAAALLKSLVALPLSTATPLAADARVHLAQCLLLLDPTLENYAQVIEQLLVESTSGVNAVVVDPDLMRMATELLAHVLVSRGAFHEAQEALRRVGFSSPSPPTADDLLFQLACCQHQHHQRVSESPSSSTPVDHLTSEELLIELMGSAALDTSAIALLRTEAQAILTGPI